MNDFSAPSYVCIFSYAQDLFLDTGVDGRPGETAVKTVVADQNNVHANAMIRNLKMVEPVVWGNMRKRRNVT